VLRAPKRHKQTKQEKRQVRMGRFPSTSTRTDTRLRGKVDSTQDIQLKIL